MNKKRVLKEIEDVGKVFEKTLGNWLTMNCPFCDCENLHIKEVYTKNGTDKAENGTYEGTIIKGISGGWRRSALAVVMFCEFGHLFEFIMQQHKGAMFLRWEEIGEYNWWEEKEATQEPVLLGAKRKYTNLLGKRK